jgi:hypothetical protein
MIVKWSKKLHDCQVFEGLSTSDSFQNTVSGSNFLIDGKRLLLCMIIGDPIAIISGVYQVLSSNTVRWWMDPLSNSCRRFAQICHLQRRKLLPIPL